MNQHRQARAFAFCLLAIAAINPTRSAAFNFHDLVGWIARRSCDIALSRDATIHNASRQLNVRGHLFELKGSENHIHELNAEQLEGLLSTVKNNRFDGTISQRALLAEVTSLLSENTADRPGVHQARRLLQT